MKLRGELQLKSEAVMPEYLGTPACCTGMGAAAREAEGGHRGRSFRSGWRSASMNHAPPPHRLEGKEFRGRGRPARGAQEAPQDLMAPHTLPGPPH